MAQEETAGTPEPELKTGEPVGTESQNGQDGGDAAQPQDEKPDRTDWKELALTYKGKIERINEVEAENKALRDRIYQTPPTSVDAGQATEMARLKQIQKDLAYLQQLADSEPEGSAAGAVARVQLEGLRAVELNQRYIVAEMAFQKVSDAEVESLGRKYWNSGDYRTPEAALKAAKGDLYDRDKDALAKEKKALDAKREMRERGTVETVPRGSAPLRENATALREMPASQWLQEYGAAEAKGDTKKIDELQKLERAGKVRPG